MQLWRTWNPRAGTHTEHSETHRVLHYTAEILHLLRDFHVFFFLVTSSPWRLRMSSVQDLPVSRYPSAPSRVRRGAWSPHNVIYYPYSSLVQVPRPNPHSPSWTTKPHWGLWNRYKSFKAKYLIARLIAPDVFLFNMPYSTAIQVQVMCLF